MRQIWMVLALSACAACVATPEPTAPPPAPAATARASATSQPPTATAIPNTAQPTTVPSPPPTATAAPQSKLPTDERGRVIGGPLVPYVNYAPTMITGKRCARVTTWTWQVVKLDPPLRPYGIADDPCVVQNAVDDFVRTEFADPAVNTPESMPAIEPLYESDPALRDGLQAPLRESVLKNYRDGRTPYYDCDKPRFKLLDVGARTPLIADNNGRVSGNAMQLTVLVVARDVEPYACRLLSYKDGKQIASFTLSEAQLKGEQRVLKVGLLWNAMSKRWSVYDYGSAEIENFHATAKALWDAAPYKP